MSEERKDSLPEEVFEAFLEGRSKVSEGYRRLRDVEPPAELDRAVLREARAAVEPPARSRAFLSGWLPRFAVAATLLVAVGVALQFDSAPVDTLPLKETVMRDAPAARAMTREPPLDVGVTGPAGAPLTRSRMPRLEIVGSETLPADVPASGGYDEQKAGAMPERQESVRDGATEPDAEAPSTESTMQRRKVARSEALVDNASASGGSDEQGAAAMSERQHSTRENAAEPEPETRARGQEVLRSGQSIESEAPRFADPGHLVEAYGHVPPALLGMDSAPDRPRSVALEAALRSRLGEGQDLADEAVLADVERRLFRVEAHFYRPSGEALTMSSLETGTPAPLPREDWLALIDALIDVGATETAQSELIWFAEAWPDHSLAPRHKALLSGD